MIDTRVQALCDEFGIEIIPAHRYPEIGQTRAVKTILRIIRRYGEDHARWVLRTLVETSNNKALIDETGLWAASDLVRAYGMICRPIRKHGLRCGTACRLESANGKSSSD